MPNPSSVSLEGVLSALKTVQDPELKKDLVSLGRVKDLGISPDGVVSLRVVLNSPAHRDSVQKAVDTALQGVQGVTGTRVQVGGEAAPKRAPGPGGVNPAQQMSIPGVSHIIAVSSGKGGVGKSTVAVNLATSLALEGARVGLMDADIYGPNVPTMMGVTEQPKMIQHPTQGEMFVPPMSHGVKVMSMGFLIEGDQPLVWRGPMLHSVVSQFLHKVDWGQLDYLVIDMPPGTGDVQLSLSQLVPVSGAVLVSTPQEVAMQDVRKAFHMFEKVRIPILGFVENMSWFECDGCSKKHFIFGEDGGKLLAKKFGAELLAQLPIAPTVRAGGDEGRPVVIRDPSSKWAQGFRELAKKVSDKIVALSAQSPADPSQHVQIGRFE